MGLKRTAQDITVSTQLGPVTVEVTAERVQAYAAAVQDTTPWYSNAFAVPIAPPAFIAILSGMPLDATYEPGAQSPSLCAMLSLLVCRTGGHDTCTSTGEPVGAVPVSPAPAAQ